MGAIVAVYLCDTYSGDESALEALYAPQLVTPQVGYQTAPPQQPMAYVPSQASQAMQYMVPQEVMAQNYPGAVQTSNYQVPQTYPAVSAAPMAAMVPMQPQQQSNAMTSQQPSGPTTELLETTTSSRKSKKHTAKNEKKSTTANAEHSSSAKKSAVPPVQNAAAEHQESNADALVRAGEDGDRKRAGTHIMEEIKKVRALQQKVLHAHADRKLVHEAPEDSRHAEGIVSKWATDRLKNTYHYSNQIDAQRTINRLRPLVRKEEALRAKEVDRERRRAEAFQRTKSWWRKLAQTERSK